MTSNDLQFLLFLYKILLLCTFTETRRDWDITEYKDQARWNVDCVHNRKADMVDGYDYNVDKDARVCYD